MSFRLKNVEATYQRLMDNVFKGRLRKNLKFYVDYMVIKFDDLETYIIDLEEVFS